jgi:2-aminoadipate transaminase
MTAADGSGPLPPGGGRRSRHSGRELVRYERLFSSRTRAMKSSAMRDLMAITERPDVISLAGGLPDTSTFPPELFAKLMTKVAVDSTARALQYGPTEGMAGTVEAIIQVMAAEGTEVDADDVIVTTGGQQVIDLVCKALLDPGDVVVAEAPTYPGAVPSFGAYEAEVVQIEMDADGMPIDVLEATLDQLEADGRRPKFIYTIPNFQNPGGVTMSLPRRQRLVQVARERELLVLEDNPYGLLRYEGEALPTLYSLDASSAQRGGASDFVIYLGTFSKILSPGLRLGWAVAPAPVLAKLNLGKQGADLCSSPMNQLFVATYFAECDWRDYVQTLRDLYRGRRDAMLEALAANFPPEASWTEPQGGMFIWVTLPDYIDTTDLLARALQTESVAFVPGRAAYLDGRGGSSMRLNFSGVDEQAIREGIRRIGKVIQTQVAMYGTLTGTRALPPSSSADAPVATEQEPPAGAPALADVVELPRRERDSGAARRSEDR